MRITPRNRLELQRLIIQEIDNKGDKCSLNHIDTSAITDMRRLFSNTNFNGDISRWDVSNVQTMDNMFSYSQFNSDISNWDTSRVESMEEMFFRSAFNGDISRWDVRKVKNMAGMFLQSSFTGNIQPWQPFSLLYSVGMWGEEEASIPYWAKIKDNMLRNKAIEAYHRKIALEKECELRAAAPDGVNLKKLKI